jgi:hypothetical protein
MKTLVPREGARATPVGQRFAVIGELQNHKETGRKV